MPKLRMNDRIVLLLNISFCLHGVHRDSKIFSFNKGGQQITNTWNVLKCDAGEGWRRSVGPIM
jgi:hypothetical protein